MVLARASGQDDRFFLINGVHYPAMLGDDGEPLPIRGAPDAAFPEPITIGDPSRATDQRTASLVLGDLTGGAGQFRYPAQAGAASLNTYAYGDADTRWAHALVQRPNLAPMGGGLTNAFAGTQIVYTGYTNAAMLAYTWYQGLYRYNPAVPAWNTTAVQAICSGLVRGMGAVYSCGDAAGTAVARSTDGVTWATLATTGLPGGLIYGLGKHDNKLYTISLPAAGNTATVYYSTNFAGASASVTWTAGGSFYVESSSAAVPEFPYQLFEWRDRYGRRALFCLTNRKILGYDDDANTWQEFEDLSPFAISTSSGVQPIFAYVWTRDDNLYLSVGSDVIYRYTGQNIDVLGPNINGGIPAGQQTMLATLCGNSRYLFAAGPGGVVDTASHGGTWAMNAQEGWHRLYTHPANTRDVFGCGYGNGKLWTAIGNGGTGANMVEQKVPDVSDNPLNATSGARDYDATNTTTLVMALFAGNAPNIPIQPLSVEVICKKMNARDLGLLAGCTVPVFYRTNSSGGWVSLGTLTSASAIPARLQINGGLGVLCNDFEVRLDLTTNSTSQTPVITDVIVHFLPQPMVRAQYTCQLDTRNDNPVFRQDAVGLPSTYYGKTAAELRGLLYAVAGMASANLYRAQVVPFLYGAGPNSNGPNAVSIAASVIRIAAVEDPLLGYGVVTVAVADVSTAPSG